MKALDGSEYSGQFTRIAKVKLPHGRGICVLSETANPLFSKYEGNWVMGRKNGAGTLTLREDESVTIKGIWKQDKMVEQKKEDK